MSPPLLQQQTELFVLVFFKFVSHRSPSLISYDLCLTCLHCAQAPVRAPSPCSQVWYATLLPEPQLPASRRPTATAAAVTPPCAPPPQAWSPADVPPPASCLYAHSPPPCSCDWAPPPTPPAPPPPCPATAFLPVNATRWWASWATTACAAL